MKCRLALLLPALLLTAGCSMAGGPVPANPAAAAVPVTLTLTPDSGAPGSEVAVEIRVEHPEQAWSGGDGKSWNFQLCWGQCVVPQWVQAIWPKPAATDPHRFLAQVKVPAFIAGKRMRAGTLAVLLACTTGPGPGCEQRPEARTQFHLTAELPGDDWAGLPPGPLQLVPALDRGPQVSVDPANPAHQAECAGGSGDAGATDGPRLRVSTDGGKSWSSTPLHVNLGHFASLSGCRAFALDPHRPGSFYVAGIRHRGASDPNLGSPPPYYTTDGGQSWQQVPSPAGFDDPSVFLGYSVSPAAVTAWFERSSGGSSGDTDRPPVVAGAATADGGATWQTVALGCPPAGACLWVVPSQPGAWLSRSLMRSTDGGKTWAWTEWQGRRLETEDRGGNGAFFLDGANLEVANAMAGAESYDGYIPLLRSTDGGQHWRWVDVPEPPGGWGKEPLLTLAPDGALRFRTPADVKL